MHSTFLSSCTLIHDGDFEGCMYIREDGEDKKFIITTPKSLEAALLAQPESTLITLEGPDRDLYDRFEVSQPPEYNTLAEGPWTTLTITVDREDLEYLILSRRTQKLQSLLEDLDVSTTGKRFAEVLEKLDSTIALLQKWSQAGQQSE